MRETRTSGLMSGDGKRSDAHAAQATAPVLDSTGLVAIKFTSRRLRPLRRHPWNGLARVPLDWAETQNNLGGGP